VDGSIRGFAPTRPGAVVLFIGELDFTTDIVGDSPDFSFHMSVPSVSVLFTDSFSGYGGVGAQSTQMPVSSGGMPYWKVCPVVQYLLLADGHLQRTGHALLAETVDLDLKFQCSNMTDSPDTRVPHTVY
jgi:autophagy-related protein 2